MDWSAIAAARRRLAREQGTIVKDWGGRLPIALIYPHTYYAGMSSLGLQTLYGLWNSMPDVVCERAFADPEALRSEPLALAAGPSTFTTSQITQHLLTNIWVVEQFLPVRFQVEGQEGEPGRVTVAPTHSPNLLQTDTPTL